MSNADIATTLSFQISKTSINHVESMRCRWKTKQEELIKSHPFINQQVKRAITAEGFKQSFLGACTSISEEIEKRASNYTNKETIDLFSNVVGLAKGVD